MLKFTEKPEPKRPKWIEGTTRLTGDKEGRSLEQYEKELGFHREELVGKTVLDLGSGSTERFSKEVKEFGIGANIISLNPDYKEAEYRQEIADNPDWQKKSIAAIGQELPFADNSFDEVLGLWSVSTYIDQGFEQVLQEICRVLKPGGVAHIGPFLAEKLPKDFKKQWQNILHGAALKIEEADEYSEEGVMLRLAFKRPEKE